MSDGLDSAREQFNALEKLAAAIPGFRGYLERETRREVDALQRRWLAEQVDHCRKGLNRSIRRWSKSGLLEGLDLAASAEKTLDRFANRIRHADYGASGLFDAVKIREPQLDALYRFDLALIEQVRAIEARIEALPAIPDADALATLLETVEAADRAFDERATVFESVTQKGAR